MYLAYKLQLASRGCAPKIIVTRGMAFCSKYTNKRLAAGLRPDPLGSLNAPPDPPAVASKRPREGIIPTSNFTNTPLHTWQRTNTILIVFVKLTYRKVETRILIRGSNLHSQN